MDCVAVIAGKEYVETIISLLPPPQLYHINIIQQLILPFVPAHYTKSAKGKTHPPLKLSSCLEFF